MVFTDMGSYAILNPYDMPYLSLKFVSLTSNHPVNINTNNNNNNNNIFCIDVTWIREMGVRKLKYKHFLNCYICLAQFGLKWKAKSVVKCACKCKRSRKLKKGLITSIYLAKTKLSVCIREVIIVIQWNDMFGLRK